MISVSGGNVQQTFREQLLPAYSGAEGEELEDCSEEALYQRLPRDARPLYQCMTSAQGCFLLLYLKNHLRQLYSIKDA